MQRHVHARRGRVQGHNIDEKPGTVFDDGDGDEDNADDSKGVSVGRLELPGPRMAWASVGNRRRSCSWPFSLLYHSHWPSSSPPRPSENVQQGHPQLARRRPHLRPWHHQRYCCQPHPSPQGAPRERVFAKAIFSGLLPLSQRSGRPGWLSFVVACSGEPVVPCS